MLALIALVAVGKPEAPNFNSEPQTARVETQSQVAEPTKAEVTPVPTQETKPIAAEQPPKPKAEVVKHPVSCEAYRPLIAQYGWNVNVAMAVMKAESGCNPNAANLTDSHATCKGSFGLFQIACMSGIVYDPAENIAIAWSKYQARGWRPWSVCTKGIVSCY